MNKKQILKKQVRRAKKMPPILPPMMPPQTPVPPMGGGMPPVAPTGQNPLLGQ